MLAVYIGNRDHRVIYSNPEALAAIKTTLLQGTTHGKITTEIDNTGRTSYGYDAIPNYEGNDRAVFMAEFEGKRYKIVIELHVFIGTMGYGESCPAPQLIKVNGKPVSGSSGSDFGSISLSLISFPRAAR